MIDIDFMSFILGWLKFPDLILRKEQKCLKGKAQSETFVPDTVIDHDQEENKCRAVKASWWCRPAVGRISLLLGGHKRKLIYACLTPLWKKKEGMNIRSDTRFGKIHAHDQFAKVTKMGGAEVCNKTSSGARTW